MKQTTKTLSFNQRTTPFPPPSLSQVGQLSRLNLMSSLFQEYFYKSQESLATVIDFVEEKVEGKNPKKTEGGGQLELEVEDETRNNSTHSSPLFPASRKRPKNLDPRRRLTPWVSGSAVDRPPSKLGE